MNVALTLEGGMRIETESADDWGILRFLPYDAENCDQDLTSRLGVPIDDAEGKEDWELFVADDLRTVFSGQVAAVRRAIEEAAAQAHEGAGQVTITHDTVEQWFGTLNQARLALEARYQFHGAAQTENSERMFAYQRSQFYTAIQGLLLDRAMRP